MTRIILFDIDLTLIHTNGAGRVAMDATLRERYGVEEPTAGIRFDGRTDRAIFLDALAKLRATDDDAFSGLVAGYLARLPAALTERGGAVLPGVEEILDELARQAAPVGLATGNMRRGAAAKLGHFGLWGRFAGGGFGDDEVERSRVVRRGMDEMAAIGRLAGETATSIVLGDTPLDVEAAHAAGARALAVATGSYDVEALKASGADWVFRDLSDTVAVLDALLN